MPLLNIALVPAPDQVVVRVTGEVDLSSAALLSDALARAAGLGNRRVVVDIAAVRFWDLSGLYVLTDFTADIGAQGRSCRIVGAPALTRRLIELAGLGSVLNLDGPVRELPPRTATTPASVPIRSPVPEHAVPARAPGGSDLVPVGRAPSTRRLWRRHDR